MPPRPAFPTPLLTERLVISGVTSQDAEELNQAVCETFADLHIWMEWAKDIPSAEKVLLNAQGSQRRFDEREDFAIVARTRDTGQIAVRSGLHPLDWDVPSFMIGYWCRAGFQGMGYVTEVVRALTRVGFETFGANRLEITCDARNIRSRRVAERCGYRLEGTMYNHCRDPQGMLRDTLVFSRTPDLTEVSAM